MEHYNSHSPADDEQPRTPSPPQMAHHYKPDVHIFSQDDGPDYHYRPPSLLQELYSDNSSYVDSHDWPQQQRPTDYTMIRRATYPCAKQERSDDYPPFLNQDTGYMSAEPGALYDDPAMKMEEPVAYQQHFYRPPAHMPPHMAPHHYAQPPPPPPPPHPYMAQHAHGYPGHPVHGYPPHGLPVQHTDDAASKETQYLRRRCYNCHTTEPPSWRRSTLNPGKIVCNKCGLYERTHLRARPLRFDELRAGGKARKGAKGAGSPKGAAKKGLGAPPQLARRSSVSSNGSSAQSGSGASDWDDSVSVYSNGSAPPTSFNSPSLGYSPHPPSLSLSSSSASPPGERDSLSRSPPLLGSPPHFAGANGIRLPHAPDMGHGGLRTKPRSNTTGGLGMSGAHGHGHGGYYAHGHALHHSSSNSSLSSHHSHGSPAMAPSPPMPPMQEAGVGEGLYRRGSMPEMQQAHPWGDMGGVSVKEEPRAVLV